MYIILRLTLYLTFDAVWGPEPIRLGFIGAPIATSVSTLLITISYVIYGVFMAPKTAWHPWTMKAFEDLGILVKLGLSGVAQLAAEVRTQSQNGESTAHTDGFRLSTTVVELGVDRS